MDKYENLKSYVQGKISELLDCDTCALTDHQVNHLHDIEKHIESLEEKKPFSWEVCAECGTENEIYEDQPFKCGECEEIGFPCTECPAIMDEQTRLQIIGREDYPSCDWKEGLGCHRFQYKNYKHLEVKND